MSKFYYNNKQQQFRCSWGIIAAFATKIEMKVHERLNVNGRM